MAVLTLNSALARGGARTFESAGARDVGEVLRQADGTSAGLWDTVVDRGQIRPFVVVLADGRDVRAADGLATPVLDSSRVECFSAIAGG